MKIIIFPVQERLECREIEELDCLLDAIVDYEIISTIFCRIKDKVSRNVLLKMLRKLRQTVNLSFFACQELSTNSLLETIYNLHTFDKIDFLKIPSIKEVI